MNQGILFALGCYGLWGVLPIYWKLLQTVPADQILAHRIIWSFIFMAFILAFKKDFSSLLKLKEKPKVLLWFVVISLLISLNWYLYIWAVNSGFIVETSLGYFINPLVSVVFGVLFLKERPRSVQWFAIGLAFIGVVYLTIIYGRPPWIALTLAVSFALYGLLKKLVQIGSLKGLVLETGILFLPALFYLLKGPSSFLNISFKIDLLLVLGGAFTCIPLLLFAASAKRLSLTTLGIMQYIAPTLQFLIGVFVYNEAFTQKQLFGFLFIWTALIIFTFDSLRYSRRKFKKTVAPPPI